MFLSVGILVISLGAIVHGSPLLGGHDAPDYHYPSHVSFRNMKNQHFCGGSIINDRWILTAAHCIQNTTIRNYIIVAGTNRLNRRGDVYWPLRNVTHGKYREYHYHDIALIKTTKKINFTYSVAPVNVPKTNLASYRRTAMFAGFGSKCNKTGVYPNALQEIQLNLVSMKRCKEFHPITEAHFCSLNKFAEGLCYGDSGGGLIVEGEIVGIASYVKPCAMNLPDVFTRVWSYKDWIIDTMDYYDTIWA